MHILKKVKSYAKTHKKLIAVILAIIIFYLILLFIFRTYRITRGQIEDLLAPIGVWGILIAFFGQILFSLTMIPDAPLAFAAMILYGPYVGSAAILGGMLVATVLNYFIARKLGRKFILKHFPDSKRFLDDFGRKVTIEKLIIFRFFSLVTFDVVAYLAPLSGVPFWKFFLSAVLGLSPLVLSHALVSQGLFSDNPLEIVLSWVIPACIAIGVAYLAKLSKIDIEDN